MTAPLLDLLRERRQALGLESMAPLLAERSRLLRRGVMIGAALLGTALGITALMFLRYGMVQAQLVDLRQYEAQAVGLRERLKGRKAKLNGLLSSNRKLAESLTSVRASSALLTELQLRTPDGVQLLAAEAKGPNLVLKGRAQDPMAFARINALELELKRSPLLDAAGMTLAKVNRQPRKDANPPAGAVQRESALPTVSFEMSGPFAVLAPIRQLEVLRQLGSEGMARRLEMLQQEDLLP
jgi:type IV pilus assembly protein PilN